MKFQKTVLVYISVGFVLGMICLDAMSVVQKLLISDPMKLQGFLIPSVMGGIAGTVISLQLYHLKGKNLQLNRYLEIEKILHHELEHRVKNNFQYIISVLSLKAMSKQDDPEIQNMLLSCRNRIESAKTMHDLVYTDMNNLSTESKIRVLVEELIENLTGRTDVPRLRLFTDLPDEGLNRDVEYNILQIIVEAVMNAVSFAYIDSNSQPELRIEMFTVKDRIFLQISDNGCGMDALSEDNDGLGIKMIYAIAAQMNAAVEFIPKKENTGGVEIILSFKASEAKVNLARKTYY